MNRWFRGGAAVVVGALALALSALPLGSARADTDASYAAFAQATSFQVTAQNPTIPAGLVVTAGGPEADVRQTSVGVGDANAAVPYVGDTVPGLPGTGAAIVGIPTPPYPLIASTNRGSEPVTTSYPGFTMRAESADFATLASATIGQDVRLATADARIEEARDGGVTATAESEARVLSLGGALLVRNARSLARVSAAPAGGEVTRTSSLSIGEISIPGIEFLVPTSAHQAGGQTSVPSVGFVDGAFVASLPGSPDQRYAVPAEPILAALEQAGFTVRYQAPVSTPTGITAPVLVFETVVPEPPPNQAYNGPTPIRYSLGEAAALVDLRATPGVPGALDAVVTPGADRAGAGAPDLAGSIAALEGAAAAGVLPSTSGIPATVVAGDQALPVTATQLLPFDTSDIYLALVGLAVLALLTTTALSLLGVRLWH